MKFNSLYQHVFLTEQDQPPVSDETSEAPPAQETPQPEGGVAEPDNYGVEPLPFIKPVSDNGSLGKYKKVLEDFANTMQNTTADCLQKLVNDIDRQGSLFQGISRETSSRVIKIASDAKELATVLEGFILNAPKRQRDIANSINQRR
jgi:hypothetical protein